MKLPFFLFNWRNQKESLAALILLQSCLLLLILIWMTLPFPIAPRPRRQAGNNTTANSSLIGNSMVVNSSTALLSPKPSDPSQSSCSSPLPLIIHLLGLACSILTQESHKLQFLLLSPSTPWGHLIWMATVAYFPFATNDLHDWKPKLSLVLKIHKHSQLFLILFYSPISPLEMTVNHSSRFYLLLKKETEASERVSSWFQGKMVYP